MARIKLALHWGEKIQLPNFHFLGVFSHTTSWGATAFTVPTASHGGTTHGGGTTCDAGRAKPGIFVLAKNEWSKCEKKGGPQTVVEGIYGCFNSNIPW